jgi:hypothetical protein
MRYVVHGERQGRKSHSRGLCASFGAVAPLLLLAILQGCGRRDLDPGDGVVFRVPPSAGIAFAQVDFPRGQGFPDSHWGSMEIDAKRLEARSGLRGGYLNVATGQARLISNMSLPPADGRPLAVYFNLAAVALGEVTSARLEIFHSDQPLQDLRPFLGRPFAYEVDDVAWAADFETDEAPYEPPSPPLTYDLALPEPPDPEVASVRQAETNVQTAVGQCFPMSVANGLQYLEDRGVITVPHDHVPGLRGDDSLVGWLDELADRIVESRELGLGVNPAYMIDGTFDYFDRNGIRGPFSPHHQDRGLPGALVGGPMLPDGDYASDGYRSRDDGPLVTFDWLFDRLLAHAAVMLCYGHPSGGGHAVRLVAAGRDGGGEWIEFVHDSLQTWWDRNDDLGLERVRTYIRGVTPTGRLILDSEDVIIRFAWAIEPIPSATH